MENEIFHFFLDILALLLFTIILGTGQAKGIFHNLSQERVIFVYGKLYKNSCFTKTNQRKVSDSFQQANILPLLSWLKSQAITVQLYSKSIQSCSEYFHEKSGLFEQKVNMGEQFKLSFGFSGNKRVAFLRLLQQPISKN